MSVWMFLVHVIEREYISPFRQISKSGPGFPLPYVVASFFVCVCVQWFEMRGGCLFCWS